MSFDAYTNAGQGENRFQPLPILASRDPVNGVDFANPGGGPYQIDQKWFNLVNFNYWRYQGQGIWVKDSGGTGPFLEFLGGTGTTGFPVFPNGLGQVTLSSNAQTILITGTPNQVNYDVNPAKVLETLTGDDGNPVGPTLGNIFLFGFTVLNGTNVVLGNSQPVFFKKNAAVSVEELDVQVTTTSTSLLKSINNAGLASFDSASFAVDSATGFVTLLGGEAANSFPTDLGTAVPAAGVLNVYGATANTSGITAITHATGNTITVFAPLWTTVNNATGSPTTTAISGGNGYLANGTTSGSLVQLSLPTACNPGDMIWIVGMGSAGWKITQGAGQQIHYGNLDTTAGTTGSLASTSEYDTVVIVCSVANTQFIRVNSTGTIAVT
jgi:hypothetical protein